MCVFGLSEFLIKSLSGHCAAIFGLAWFISSGVNGEPGESAVIVTSRVRVSDTGLLFGHRNIDVHKVQLEVAFATAKPLLG